MSNSSPLVYEVEHTLYESSSTWEGIDAQEIPLDVGEVILRTQAGFAAAMPLRFHPPTAEASLDRVIERLTHASYAQASARPGKTLREAGGYLRASDEIHSFLHHTSSYAAYKPASWRGIFFNKLTSMMI